MGGIWDVVIKLHLQELLPSGKNVPGWLVSYSRQHCPQRKDLSVPIGKKTFRKCEISEYLPGIESGQPSPIL
jgi:hypothetical protein